MHNPPKQSNTNQDNTFFKGKRSCPGWDMHARGGLERNVNATTSPLLLTPSLLSLYHSHAASFITYLEGVRYSYSCVQGVMVTCTIAKFTANEMKNSHMRQFVIVPPEITHLYTKRFFLMSPQDERPITPASHFSLGPEETYRTLHSTHYVFK